LYRKEEGVEGLLLMLGWVGMVDILLKQEIFFHTIKGF
jgi:hypothetical protein